MNEIISYITSAEFILSAFIVIAVAVIIAVAGKLVKKYKSKLDDKGKAQNMYFNGIIRGLKALLIALTVVSILQINGINVTSLVAGLGLASAIVGLALQDFLKDVIMGTNIVADKFFSLGDAVRYGTFEGIVVDFNIKSTKIKNIYNGDIITVCNRNITEITVMSNVNDISVPLSYDEDVNTVNKVLIDAAKKIEKLDNIEKCVYEGTEEFCDSSIKYAVRFWCKPEFRREAKIKAVQTIQKCLDENNIKIPYNQLDIHNVT